MSVDFPDYQEPAKIATSIGTTDLTGTGLAKEAGGNLATHTSLLNGTTAGALVGVAGNTIGKETAAWLAGGAVGATPGGVPLLHGIRQAYRVVGQVIAAAGTFTTPAITFTKPGYVIRVVAQMSAAGAATPTVEADLNWTVAATGADIGAEEHWWLPAGGTSTKRTTGRGPTKGDTLTITFTNGDPVDTCTISITVWETTQHMARDDWRSDGAVTSATGVAAAGDALGNILASETVNVPANSTGIRNLPLYAGQADIWINQNLAAGSQVQVVPTGAFSVVSGNPLASLDWTLAAHTLTGVILPRCWCSVQAVNNAGAVASFSYTVTALEHAS